MPPFHSRWYYVRSMCMCGRVCCCVCVCGLTRWWNVNPCDRIILWGVPRCHLFNSMRCSSITAWNGPPKLCILHTNSTHRGNKEKKRKKERKKERKEPLSSLLSFHHFFKVSSEHVAPFPPKLSCSFTPGVPLSNPSHQENRKSENRKFPNKSLWHREHLLTQRVYYSFCVRSKSRWRLQYVLSLWTSLIVCETSCRDKQSTFPLEDSH